MQQEWRLQVLHAGGSRFAGEKPGPFVGARGVYCTTEGRYFSVICNLPGLGKRQLRRKKS